MSDLLDMLLDQAGRLFTDHIDRDLLAAAETGAAPAALAEAVAAFGLVDALTIPAADGGLQFAEAGSLFALFGAQAVPLPLGEAMLARAVLAAAGIDAADGMIGLVGPDGSAAHAATLQYVLDTRDERLVFLPAQTDTRLTSIARTERALLDTSATPVTEAAWPSALPDVLTLGAMLRASQIAGACERLLAMSVDYANTRVQFGRPIGRFQAVQQLLAQLAAEAAAARASADFAWAALDAGQLGWAGAIAKIRAGEAARKVAAIAHQVHGAIGITDEHLLHYFTRRLWEWRLDFGSDGWWADRLGAAAGGAPDGLWDFLVTECGRPAATELV